MPIAAAPDAAKPRPVSGQAALAAGIAAVLAACACWARIATYEGPGLIGYIAAALGALALGLCVVAFVLALRVLGQATQVRLGVAALVCAVGAFPLAMALEVTVITVLNAAGVYW